MYGFCRVGVHGKLGMCVYGLDGWVYSRKVEELIMYRFWQVDEQGELRSEGVCVMWVAVCM